MTETKKDNNLPIPVVNDAVLEMQRALVLAYEELKVITVRVSPVFVVNQERNSAVSVNACLWTQTVVMRCFCSHRNVTC